MIDNALVKEKALEFLNQSKLMTLATSVNDSPWAVTVNYAVTINNRLLFFSGPATRHCQDLLKNPQVAVAIRGENLKKRQIKGIQLIGTARKAAAKQLSVFKKRHAWVDDYPDHELYEIIPDGLYYFDSDLFGHYFKVEVKL